MSIRWIRNVVIDDAKSTIEIQIGDHHIGDKCYIRVNNELESWFIPTSNIREDVIAQGVQLLQQRLENRSVKYPDGNDYDWK